MKNFLKVLFIFLLLSQICLAQWIQTNFPSYAVNCLASREVSLYAGTYGNYIFRSTDDGDNWTVVGSESMCPTIGAITFSGANMIVGTGGEPCRDEGGVCLSTDNGTSWNQVLDGRIVVSLASNDNKVFAESNGMWFSSDYGMTWDSVNNGLPNSVIRALVISGSNTFAGSFGDGVFLTKDNGNIWTTVNNGLLNLFIFSLAVLDNYIFAGTADGIYLTSDNGANWHSVNTGLPTGFSVTAFAVINTNIFVSIRYNQGNTYNSSVYLTTNYGGTWNDVGSGLPIDVFISALTIKGNNIFAAGQNVWRRPLSEMITGIELNSDKLPQSFIFNQNYPNPFNPSTSITYSIPQTEKVILRVFDILGKDTETLVNEEKSPGNYDVNFNATNLPSGVYFYRLQAGSFVETKKMILLK